MGCRSASCCATRRSLVITECIGEKDSGETMKVAVTGASGFLGHNVSALLEKRGHWVKAESLRDGRIPDLAGCDAVVHLAGEPVAQRWTAAARKRIVESRVDGTRRLVAAMKQDRPNVLVSASGIGYYGS